MSLSNKLMASGLAVLALLATAGAAFAAPAYATGNVNVRSGPGTGYARIDVLRRGDQVDVQGCEGSWCYVEKRGPDGWVSSSYLSRSGGYQPPPVVVRPSPPPYYDPYPPRPPHWNPRPPRPSYPYPSHPSYPGYGNDSSVCFNGPNGYFCVGN